LAAVLLRNVARDGWSAPYFALTTEGQIISLEEWFSIDRDVQNENLYIDPINRLNNLACPMTGDLLLISNYADGFYFGAPITGIHGGLHPEDSKAVLAYGFPGVNGATAEKMRIGIDDAVQKRCKAEGNRHPSTADLMTGLLSILE